MNKKITVYPNKVLNAAVPEISKKDINSDTFSVIGSSMLEIMRDSHGIGLSANQVGLPLNMCVIEVVKGNPYIMLNPRIIKRIGKPKKIEEGCLSLPTATGLVSRWDTVEAEYEDVRGETQNLRATGVLAQAIQHETDHLQGITILNRMSEYHRTKARKKIDQWKRYRKKGMI